MGLEGKVFYLLVLRFKRVGGDRMWDIDLLVKNGEREGWENFFAVFSGRYTLSLESVRRLLAVVACFCLILLASAAGYVNLSKFVPNRFMSATLRATTSYHAHTMHRYTSTYGKRLKPWDSTRQYKTTK